MSKYGASIHLDQAESFADVASQHPREPAG